MNLLRQSALPERWHGEWYRVRAGPDADPALAGVGRECVRPVGGRLTCRPEHVAVLEMGQDEGGAGDIADLARAGGDAFESAPPAFE